MVEPADARDEVGFLLLEDCFRRFDCEGLKRNAWLDVDFRSAKDSYQDEVDVCLRGNIALGRYKEKDGAIRFVLKSTTRFDGSITDIQHSPSSCPKCCKEGQTNRSDLALLVGLAMTCEENDHIQIETMQLRLHARALSSGDGDACAPHRIAFLITFSMPMLNAPNNEKRKLLPTSTQLLLSIMRSDWDFLKYNMGSEVTGRFQDDSKLCHNAFFPPKMSLEELYVRLRGLQAKSEMKPSRNKASFFAMLPNEILRGRIAPFLRARSLDAWRCSCSDLHLILKTAVPGLRLSLYNHQIRSLEWMRCREKREWTENEIMQSKCSLLGIDGDGHRCVTAGATVLLRTRRKPSEEYRIDTKTGKVCNDFFSTHGSEHLSRRAARGGLLCDDPGLGKTITVLALILQTMGLSTEEKTKTKSDKVKASISHDEIFDAYWGENLDHVYQRHDLNRITRQVQRLDREQVFLYDVCLNENPDYLDVIKQPMCFHDIFWKIDQGAYAKSFSSYEDDVKLMFHNAIAYNEEGNYVYELAEEMLGRFNNVVSKMKNDKVVTARKSFANASARPDSAVAAILERKIKQELIDALIPSSATLLVVPETLLTHWQEQITMHVDLRYWTSHNHRPVIFHFRPNDRKSQERLNEILTVGFALDESPLIFVDHSGTAKLPEPEFLAMFKVVVTTTKRFTNEFTKGSFADEMKQKNGTTSPYAVHRSSKPNQSACSLLKIRWTRMVVDEGHSMGRGKRNNAILFASWINATKRWSMTGTPTPQTTCKSGMDNLSCLMGFLEHEFFKARLAGDKVWKQLSKYWNAGSLASFFQTRSLLAVLMMRHTKLDIAEVPPPIYRKVWLHMSRDEQTTFNTLVSGIQQNILITSMKGKTSGLQDSLLHKSQTKSARLAFENLRLACSGGLRIIPKITNTKRRETMAMFSYNQMEGVKKTIVNNYLERVVNEELSHCMNCGFEVSTLLILPCGDLICSECMSDESTKCLICDVQFDVDFFQKLQPGSELEWYDNYKQEDAKKKLEAAASDDDDNLTLALFLNAGLVQGDHAGRIAIQPAVRTSRKRKRGDGHECLYPSGDGKCMLCHDEHDECVMIAEGSRCLTCFRTSEKCPAEESKFYRVISRLDELLVETRRKHTQKRFLPATASFAGEQIAMAEDRPLKVLIFSQFRQVLNLIGHRLLRRYGPGAVAEYWGSYRTQELAKFIHAKDCFCMILSKDGSEGLDLSFVTHIFFLEEIWDKSLQDQAVARAWRMGAKGRVEVVTLLARDSVESLMADFDQKKSDQNAVGKDETKGTDVMTSKMRIILSSVRFIGRIPPAAQRQILDEGRSVNFED